MHRLPLIDLTVIIVYFVANMGLGIYFMRKSKTAETYMSAGGSIPSWVVGMSIFATYVSSISFLALPGNAYKGDWSRFTFSLSIPIAAWCATKFFVPLYRDRGEISAYSYLENRFGPVARGYAAVFYLLTQIGRMGAVIYLMALPLHALLGVSVPHLIIFTGITTMIYAMLGGIEGVIWTEAIQGCVKIGGALLSAIILLFSMPKGPGQMFSICAADHKFALGSMDIMEFGKATFWVILLNGIFTNLNNFGIDQNYVQRFHTARSEAEAKKAVWFGSTLYIPVSFIFFFIGSALYAYYKARPDLLPVDLRSPDMGDKVFPFFIVSGLPTGVTGLLVAAVFAAAMSTIATSLNSSATIIYSDFYKRYFRPNAQGRESMIVLYTTNVVWGILGISMGLRMIGSQSALDAWWKYSSISSGGMLGLFLLGYFAKRATNAAAITGICVGLIVIIWMVLSPWLAKTYYPSLAPYASPFHEFLVIVIGTAVIFLTGFIISTLFPGKKAPQV